MGIADKLHPAIARLRRLLEFKSGILLIPVAALLASAPRILSGVSCGHDFEFHLISWMEIHRSWTQGILYPHWAQSPNWGAGEARFVFYPPLTSMIGAALGFLLPWQWVPAAMVFLFLTAAGLATRALARAFLPALTATLAGILATSTPYALFASYERTAFAEVAAAAFIPLLLMYTLKPKNRLARQREIRVPHVTNLRPGKDSAQPITLTPIPYSLFPVPYSLFPSPSSRVPIALLIAAIWLTNAPAGVMASYLVAFAALAAAIVQRSFVPVVRALIAVPIGLGLAAFYLVPAAWEQRWIAIHQALDIGMRVADSWLFARHHNPDLALHDQILHTASILVAITVTLAAAAFLQSLRIGKLTRPSRHFWLPLALLVPILLLLQFQISAPIWNLPKLQFLQFPWRWLMVLGTPLCIFLAAATPLATRRSRLWAALGWTAALIAMAAIASHSFCQFCDEEDNVQNQIAIFQTGDGVEGIDEYAPLGADNTLVSSNLPDACLVPDPTAELGEIEPGTDIQIAPEWTAEQGSCDDTFNAKTWQTEHKIIPIDTDHAGFLVLRLRRYPAWQITVDQKPVQLAALREDGLVVLPVPAGQSTVEAQWTTTPDILWGRIISAASLFVLAAIAAISLFQRKRRKRI